MKEYIVAEQEDTPTPSPNEGEREFETGMDEAWKARGPRTYDEYQNESLEGFRSIRKFVDRIATNAATADHLATLQAIAHRDVLLDKILRLEPSEAAAQSAVLPTFFRDAVKEIVIEALREAAVGEASEEAGQK